MTCYITTYIPELPSVCCKRVPQITILGGSFQKPGYRLQVSLSLDYILFKHLVAGLAMQLKKAKTTIVIVII